MSSPPGWNPHGSYPRRYRGDIQEHTFVPEDHLYRLHQQAMGQDASVAPSPEAAARPRGISSAADQGQCTTAPRPGRHQ